MEFIILIVLFLAFYLCSYSEAPRCATIFVVFEHMFKGDLACLWQSFYTFVSVFITHIYPIFIEWERICFGSSILLILWITHSDKGILSNKVNAMAEICKEGQHWDFPMKFYFVWLYHLNSGTSWWMFENSLHCSFIFV